MGRINRRDFIGTTAVGTAALIGTSSPASALSRVLGANDRINIAFIGNGMQFQTLVRMFQTRRRQKNDEQNNEQE